jgi:signal peptidase I
MRMWMREALPVIIAYVILGLLGIFVLQSYKVLWVSGGSMSPALVPGDVVVVSTRAPLRRGDIALLKPGAGLVLHRVTRVEDDGRVWARGDANPVADLNPTRGSDVHGRVARVLPIGTFLKRWRAGGGCDTLPAQSDSARL